MEEKVVEQKTAVAELRHARISARKVKIVIDLIRGKSAKEAIAILKYTNKAAAPMVEKLVKSAIANAVNNALITGLSVNARSLSPLATSSSVTGFTESSGIVETSSFSLISLKNSFSTILTTATKPEPINVNILP